MDRMDDLKMRIELVIAELKNITQLLERNISESEKTVSFGQVKEIEDSITRLKKQGLPVPTELTELKIALLSKYEQYRKQIDLRQQLQQSIRSFIKQETSRLPKGTQISKTDADSAPGRRSPNYEKPLGSKGYSNLEDYLIPVIKLMWSGLAHKEAFQKIAQKLDVRYNTVSSQCTRALDLTTDDFISQVNTKTIISLLEKKYPDRTQKIKAELKA